jgi:hypothetical protein
VFSRGNENGFVGATDCFVVFERMKRLHGIAITAVRRKAGDGLGWTNGAKHNAVRRNMIAWRRRVSMLDPQIPSKVMSAQVVPRFDADTALIREPTF